MNISGKQKSNKRTNWTCNVLLLVGFFTGCAGNHNSAGLTASVPSVPFSMPEIKEPAIPDKTFVLTDFGAVGDGHRKNTDAFAKAIGACAAAGGGRVVVPAGLWLTGPVQLTSHLNLYLERGAVILFSPTFEDYPLNKQTYEGSKSVRCMSPLSGKDLEDIAITGDGIIDGSGQAWRPVKKGKLTANQWKELLASGGAVEESGNIWWPSQEALNGAKTVAQLDSKGAEVKEYAAARQYLRPVMVSLVNCKNVLLDGPTFQNSPAWNIHPLLCENMIIRNIDVRNPWYSQNGDGMDLESCRNVLVYNCRFDVGDDAMCMKSGRDEDGRRRGKPTENVVIRDCTVYHGHGGFVVGSEMSGGVRNISVSHCEFLGTDVGIRFKSTRGRGGVVENIFIQDIRMTDIATEAILFDLYYSSDSPDPEQSLEIAAEPAAEGTPRFQNIKIRNVVCRGAESAIYIQGLPEMPVRQIEIENVEISAKTGATCIDADQIMFKNVKLLPQRGPAFGLYNSRNIFLKDGDFDPSNGMVLKVAGNKSGAIHLKGADRSRLVDKISFGKDAGPNMIIWE